jgi:hypothetical protein
LCVIKRFPQYESNEPFGFDLAKSIEKRSKPSYLYFSISKHADSSLIKPLQQSTPTPLQSQEFAR